MNKQKTKPDYKQKSLHRIPGTIAQILGEKINRPQLPEQVTPEKQYKNVMLLLIDGFGHKHWKKHSQDKNLLKELKQKGKTHKLKTVYPSETAAAITSLHTGLTPSQHGIIGWNMYIPEHEAYIKTLPFKTSEWQDIEEKYEDFTPETLFKGESAYPLLEEKGIRTHTHIPHEIEDTTASNYMFEEAEQKPYLSLADLTVQLRNEIQETENTGKNYFYAYIPLIDKISHHKGTESDEYEAQLSQITHALQKHFLNQLKPEQAENTLLIMTADHGFLDTQTEQNINLFQEPLIEESLQEKTNGEKIMPFGSVRNTHLKLKPDKKQEVQKMLEKKYEAHVWTKEEALEKQIFGSENNDTFKDRIGDIIISHKNQGLWHEEDELEIIGHHGGLTKDEMQIPFITIPLKELIQELENKE